VSDMTDLEMTRLCAEAMEPEFTGVGSSSIWGYSTYWINGEITKERFVRNTYDPLHDDAQAMALVKKFDGVMLRNENNMYICYLGPQKGRSDNLNRAIVECVAKMQKAKQEAHA